MTDSASPKIAQDGPDGQPEGQMGEAEAESPIPTPFRARDPKVGSRHGSPVHVSSLSSGVAIRATRVVERARRTMRSG